MFYMLLENFKESSGGFRGGSLGSMEPLFVRLVNSSSPAS